MTIIGTMTSEGLGPTIAIKGSMNEGIFLAYLREELLPNIAPGKILVMDRLGVHRTRAVREEIERAGCRLLLLPPYSPELNPIEEAWSKLKNALRKIAARTLAALLAAVTEAAATIDAEDARGWVHHAGYAL